MICPNCSAENTGGNFCTNCGSPLPSSNVVEPLKDAALEPDAVEMPGDPNTPPTYNHAPGQADATYIPPFGAETQETEAAATPEHGTSSDGILNQAWDDLIHDPSMVKKTLLMALIELVPILNFVCSGYALRWGRRAAFRTGDKLPQRIFGDHAFETGFYVFVITFVWAFALGLISVVPLAGFIFALAAVPFVFLAMGYMSMVDELGAGFRLSNLWEKGKRSFGGLLALTYVPGLVVGVVASILCSIAMIPMGISAFGIYEIIQYGTSSSAASALGLTASIFVIALILVYVLAWLTVFARLISYRALGYWMGRMAPEWIQESVQKGTDPR